MKSNSHRHVTASVLVAASDPSRIKPRTSEVGGRDVYLSAQNVRRLGSQNPDGRGDCQFQ